LEDFAWPKVEEFNLANGVGECPSPYHRPRTALNIVCSMGVMAFESSATTTSAAKATIGI
ncbi:MAG: hypothetical protein WCP99_20545, partial [Burkholderiales bacterium]